MTQLSTLPLVTIADERTPDERNESDRQNSLRELLNIARTRAANRSRETGCTMYIVATIGAYKLHGHVVYQVSGYTVNDWYDSAAVEKYTNGEQTATL